MPVWETALGSGLVALLGSLFGGGKDSGVQMTGPDREALSQLLGIQAGRVKLQNPLYEEATQLSRALLPRSAQPSAYHLSNYANSEGGYGGGGYGGNTDRDERRRREALTGGTSAAISGLARSPLMSPMRLRDVIGK